MKKIALLLIAILCGAWDRGTSTANLAFVSAQLWGGGLVVGQDALSSLHATRTDTFGGYLLGNDGTWHQLITSQTFSQAVCNGGVAGSCFGYYQTTGTSQVYQGSAGGVIEVCISPANTTIGYMFFNGLIFYSTNISAANPDAIIWHNTNELGGGGFTKTTDQANTVANRVNGRFIACDPNNSSHLFVGTAASGLWETKDAGNSFAQVSSSDIPQASSTNGINYSIAFDPNSGVNGSGLTNTVYVFTNGAPADIYWSVVGGGSGNWNRTTSGATLIQHMVVCSDDKLWAVTGVANATASALLKFVPSSPTGPTGSWSTEIAASASLHSVACNPSNANHIVALGIGGAVRITTTGPGGFGSSIAYSLPLGSGDTPYLGTLASNIFSQTAADISLDASDNMLFDGGQGVWTGALPTGGSFTWTAKVKGILQPIGQQIIVPTSLTAVAGVQDNGSCTFKFNVVPTNCIPITQYKSLEFATGLAVSATDQNFMVAKISSNFSGLSDYSGYSTDSFQNNYQPFNKWLVTVPASGCLSNSASTPGLIRISLAGGCHVSGNVDTSALTTWTAGSGSIICSYATGAATTSALNNGAVACYPVTVIDSTHIDLQSSVCPTNSTCGALATTGFDYVIYQPPPTILSNWGGSLNITGTASDSGKIQVGFMFNSASLVNNAPVHIAGVLGTTEANGDWTISNLNTAARTFDLGPTSTFTNAYTGGGVASTWEEPGGAIAAASDTNFALVGADQPLAPKCTTDGGATWSDVTNAAIPAVKTTVATGASAGGTSVTLTSTIGLLATQVIQIVMDDGRYFYTTISSVSSPTINFTTAIPAGRSIANGANLYQTLGWPNAVFLNSHPLDADKVNGTFYAVNSLSGMITWTGCGATTLVSSDHVGSGNGTFQNSGGNNSVLKAVPGNAGHIFWTVGSSGSPNSIAGNGLFQNCTGGIGMSAFSIRNTFGVQFVGFGPPAAGKTYPSILAIMWYDTTNSNSEAASTFGIWRSIDNPGDCSGSGTFQQLCSDGTSGTSCPVSTTWPLGLMFTFKDISGDPTAYGPVYINTGAGPIYGRYNSVLERDLDPASNDNSPAWLNKVA